MDGMCVENESCRVMSKLRTSKILILQNSHILDTASFSQQWVSRNSGDEITTPTQIFLAHEMIIYGRLVRAYVVTG
jgi:hypothetical protein